MSTINCDSCADLREYAPEFVQNGVTDTVAASLKNNNGFNPRLTVLRDNCADLNAANDCLLGRMKDEIEAYDVCDWKEFMSKLLPNQYEVLKALIAGDCGQWARIGDICTMLDAILSPPLNRYGTLDHFLGDQHPERRGGRIHEKNGVPNVYRDPAIEANPDSGIWRGMNIGLQLAFQTTKRCSDGSCRKLFMYQPDMTGYRLREGLSIGDILWSVDYVTAKSWGIADSWWQAYRVSSWAWYSYIASDSAPYSFIALRLHVGDTNELELSFVGETDSITSRDVRVSTPENIERVDFQSC